MWELAIELNFGIAYLSEGFLEVVTWNGPVKEERYLLELIYHNLMKESESEILVKLMMVIYEKYLIMQNDKLILKSHTC